ncbi:hypothetical protein ABBQ38_014283 [Trebouxia sp. C0009 RCD-2024]
MSCSEINSASVSISLDPDDVAASKPSRVTAVHRPGKQLLDSRDIPGPHTLSLGGNAQQYMCRVIVAAVVAQVAWSLGLHIARKRRRPC